MNCCAYFFQDNLKIFQVIRVCFRGVSLFLSRLLHSILETVMDLKNSFDMDILEPWVVNILRIFFFPGFVRNKIFTRYTLHNML